MASTTLTKPTAGRTIPDGQPLTPNQLIWRRFVRHRGAVLGAIGAGLVVLFILIGSLLVPYERLAICGSSPLPGRPS